MLSVQWILGRKKLYEADYGDTDLLYGGVQITICFGHLQGLKLCYICRHSCKIMILIQTKFCQSQSLKREALTNATLCILSSQAHRPSCYVSSRADCTSQQHGFSFPTKQISNHNTAKHHSKTAQQRSHQIVWTCPHAGPNIPITSANVAVLYIYIHNWQIAIFEKLVWFGFLCFVWFVHIWGILCPAGVGPQNIWIGNCWIPYTHLATPTICSTLQAPQGSIWEVYSWRQSLQNQRILEQDARQAWKSFWVIKEGKSSKSVEAISWTSLLSSGPSRFIVFLVWLT